jgi:hypothetical protein
MSGFEDIDWRSFLEGWNTQAMSVHLRALRRNGIGDSSEGGRGDSLRAKAQRFGLKIPEGLFQPLGDLGSDAEILAEAQTRIEEVVALLKPAIRKRWPKLDSFSDDYHWAAIRHGGHYFAPAAEDEIAAAERRLGVPLPPSYKDFLRISNGWLTISSRIVPVEGIAWLRDKGPGWVENFGIGSDSDADQAMRQHLVYGKQQDPPRYRSAYVRECLQLSDTLAEINCVFLLNPALVFETGECEAWFLAAWLPGARRFKSFYELMYWMRTVDLSELNRCEEQRRPLR